MNQISHREPSPGKTRWCDHLILSSLRVSPGGGISRPHEISGSLDSALESQKVQ